MVKPNINQPQSIVVHVVASKPDENTINESLSLPHNRPKVIVSSHVEVISDEPKPSVKVITPAIISSHVEVRQQDEPSMHVVVPKKVEVANPVVILSSIVEVHSSEDEENVGEEDDETDESENESNSNENDDLAAVLQVENNIGEPEYDFLSRQPSEFAEETFRIHNISPTKSRQKTRSATPVTATSKHDSLHPTGLVTKLGGTVVKDGATTVHETSVIGTYISGKYAQVLQSTSHIFHNTPAKPKIAPTASLRILKTAAPHIPKHNKHAIEPTPARQSLADTNSLPIDDVYGNSQSPSLVRTSRRPSTSTGSFKNRFRNRNSNDDGKDYGEIPATAPDAPPSAAAFTSSKKARVTKNKRYEISFDIGFYWGRGCQFF